MNKNNLIKIIREEIESVLNEVSLRDIKSRIRQILDLEEVQKYKMDNFTYENIPFSIFEANGISPLHLKQYEQSSDIVTYDLGININPIKKNVDIFLQKKGIFDGVIKESMQRYCDIYKTKDGSWYMDLADSEHGEYEDAYTYGPFQSEQSVDLYLRKNFSNPGSSWKDDSGKRDVPKVSPNGYKIQNPKSRVY